MPHILATRTTGPKAISHVLEFYTPEMTTMFSPQQRQHLATGRPLITENSIMVDLTAFHATATDLLRRSHDALTRTVDEAMLDSEWDALAADIAVVMGGLVAA